MSGEILWINDTDAREKGFFVTPGLRGIMGATPRPVTVERVIGKHGGVMSGTGFHTERPLEIPGVFVTDAVENVHEDWRVVQQELLAATVKLRHAYAPDLEYIAKWADEDATFADLALEAEQDMVLRFVAPHPFGRHIAGSPFTVNFTATPTVVPSGLFACRGTIILTGGTNPIVRLHDPDDNVVASMTITRTHTGEQATKIQSHLHKVMYHVNNADLVGTSARGTLTAGSFFEVEPLKYGATPMDASPEYLKLSVSSGAGTFVYDKYS